MFVLNLLYLVYYKRNLIFKYTKILREEFVNYKPYDKYTNHAPNYQTNLTVKLKERFPTYEEMRAKYNLDSKENFDLKKEPIQIRNIGYTSQEETRQRKLELMRGAKDLLRGIAPTSITSCYQDVYR